MNLIQRHHAIVREALERWRGVEIDTAGDGSYATFDGPARAIRCALDISQRVRELGIESVRECTRANARSWTASAPGSLFQSELESLRWPARRRSEFRRRLRTLLLGPASRSRTPASMS
jgi:hypothetical protein